MVIIENLLVVLTVKFPAFIRNARMVRIALTTEAARIERIEKMLSEIYHHLGLDGSAVISMQDRREQVESVVPHFENIRA